jgi:F0F1-type ATP synthase delta subunit
MIPQQTQGKEDVLIYFDLITSLKTTQEVADFICEIDALIFTLLRSEEMTIGKALDSISIDSAKKINQVFTKNGLNIDDKDAVVRFLETLKELLRKFKVIKIILAIDPTRKIITDMHNFVKDTIGVGYILDIEISEDILGGAIIMFNGKYYDFSLKKDIEDIFKAKKDQIVSIIG